MPQLMQVHAHDSPRITIDALRFGSSATGLRPPGAIPLLNHPWHISCCTPIMLGVLDTQQIEELLHAEAIGRIGCHAAGRTYVVPITYAYDGKAVYAHSAEGLKLSMMRQNPAVCFEVERMDDLACWRSVIAWGRFEELSGDDAARGMQLLIDRLRPRMVSATATPSHGHHADTAGRHAIIYRVALTEKTGRFERHDATAPPGQPLGAAADASRAR